MLDSTIYLIDIIIINIIDNNFSNSGVYYVNVMWTQIKRYVEISREIFSDIEDWVRDYLFRDG